MKYLAVILISLGVIPLFFSGAAEQMANFSYDFCNMLMLPAVLFYLFLNIPQAQFANRGIVVVLFIEFSFKVITYLSYMLSLSYAPLLYVVTIGLSLLMLLQTLNWKYTESDAYEDTSTYFIFKKPIGFLDFIITFFKLPLCSFSIVNKDNWYKFSRDQKGLHMSSVGSMNLNEYIFIKVPDIKDKLLKSLVGTQWKLRKSNCITVFKPVFSQMGITLSALDFIPSIFAYKFFKNYDRR